MNQKTKNEFIHFIKLAKQNMEASPYNAFLDQKLDPDHPEWHQIALSKLGHPEFSGPSQNWPSLYLSTQVFLDSPYHRTIRFNQINDDELVYQTLTIEAHRLFNLKAIQSDPDKSLKDWMVLRAMDEPYDAGILTLDEEVWMIDAPSEQASIDPFAQKAHGRVLSFGLGIGYFLYMVSLNPNVKELVVIENNRKVIDVFNQYILPQFNLKIPFQIIHGDAYDHFNADTLDAYDYVFVDIYQSSHDGLPVMETLLEQCYLEDKLDFWIESSCTEILPALILLSFEAFLKKQAYKHSSPLMMRLHHKINHSVDMSLIQDVEALKDLMYDAMFHRRLLSTHLDEALQH